MSDDGRPDARLAAAVAAYDGSPAAYGAVLAALATARVFLALSAQALATERSAQTGLRQESAAQMSLLSLVSGTGERALPAFLDGHEVQRWRAQARPVPAPGPLACTAVLDDGADALLLDPAGAAVVVRAGALRELAAGRVPVVGAALSSRTLAAGLGGGPGGGRGDGLPELPAGLVPALGRALEGEPVRAARLLAGPDGPVLALVGDLPPAALAALADRVRRRLGADLPATGLDVARVPGDGPGVPVPLPRPPRRLLRRR